MAIVLSILDQNGAKSPKMHQKANLSGLKITLSEVFCVTQTAFFEKLGKPAQLKFHPKRILSP
jgi:hypothetical protein